jgi:hypothetical protein
MPASRKIGGGAAKKRGPTIMTDETTRDARRDLISATMVAVVASGMQRKLRPSQIVAEILADEDVSRTLLAVVDAPVGDEVVEPPRFMSAVPMIRRGANWCKVHYNEDGTIGRDVSVEEADAVGVFEFHMLVPTSQRADAAIAAMRGANKSPAGSRGPAGVGDAADQRGGDHDRMGGPEKRPGEGLVPE